MTSPCTRRARATGPQALVLCGLVALEACGRRAQDQAPAVGDAAAPPASVARVAGGSPTPSPASTSFYATRFSRRPAFFSMVELGRKLFFDPSLSASGKMSCATCHDPRFAYGPPGDRPVMPGGVDGTSPGLRAVPSLRYQEKLRPFTEHTFDEAVDESVDQGPSGGHGWDGRVDAAHDQARLPLTSPFEMANPSVEAVAARVAQGSLAADFRQTFGDDVFADPARGTIALLTAIEVFEQSPKDFYPYSSRFDMWLAHKGDLVARELRGMALFADRNKGNCASCHPHSIRQGAFPQLTDFGYAALGVPRNRAIPANADPGYHDLGLTGPLRTDLASHREYCGQFRVPTLRNVARRRVFFHNGAFHRLEDALAFYAQRDTDPARFYPSAGGKVDAYDDLPPECRANVNREPPFGRKRGAAPALSAAEIEDVVAFLKTLTDADQPQD